MRLRFLAHAIRIAPQAAMRHIGPKVLTVWAVTALSLQASVIYNFSGTGIISTEPPEPLAFQLTVPNFVNPPLGTPPDVEFVFFSCAQLDFFTNCDAGAGEPGGGISFANQAQLSPFSAFLSFGAVNGVGYGFTFPAGALGAPGTYQSSSSSPGTLVITATSAVPEPGTGTTCILGGICFLLASRQAGLKCKKHLFLAHKGRCG